MTYSYQIKTVEEYDRAYQKSLEDPGTFWEEIAENFVWKKRWQTVFEGDFRSLEIKWFSGAMLNITENCLDRHLPEHGERTALIWEPNDPEEAPRKFTYRELHREVTRFAHVLKNNGVRKGDRVCIYMGMVPELAIAVLACARIGAIHSVIFGGFSAKSISDRLVDGNAHFVITCDGSFRGKKEIHLKNIVDDALLHCDFVKRVIVLTRTRTAVSMIKGRDVWWEEEMDKIPAEIEDIPAEPMDAEDPLFILYTSGSTGRPKGVVHTCGGYMVFTTYTFVNVFQYQPETVFFCTADVGWITGHSYLIYGPLCAGATTLMFEGIPTFPDAGRLWEIVEKHQVHTIYTAPTAIRSLMSYGSDYVMGHDLSSLKVLGSVGEPINEEAWNWYHRYVGRGQCPIVDTWWQTETGGIMISSLAGVTHEKPTFATMPLPGIQPVLLDDQGKEIHENGLAGNLSFKFSWPGMLRTTWGDPERFRKTYFEIYPGYYFSGDGALRDVNGDYRITGRVDDVLNVSGHRVGTAEIENAINMHADVVESAVVGYPHEIKGQGIYAFVIYGNNLENESLSREDIRATVSRLIGSMAKPDKIQFVKDLPKTRSGKIMRRILRKIAEGETQNTGDHTTLLNPEVVEEIIKTRLNKDD